MKKYILAALCAACCVAGSSAASAWIVTVREGGVVVASWAQSPNPILAPADYVLGNYADVPVFGSVGLGGDSEVIWYDPANNGGGLSSFGGNLNIVGGPSFTNPGAFSGTTAAPMFRLGTYFGTDLTVSTLESIPATITISVPEPTSWAMMLAGLGAIGVATRLRRTVRIGYAGVSAAAVA